MTQSAALFGSFALTRISVRESQNFPRSFPSTDLCPFSVDQLIDEGNVVNLVFMDLLQVQQGSCLIIVAVVIRVILSPAAPVCATSWFASLSI